MGARAAKGAQGPRLVTGPKSSLVDRAMEDRFVSMEGPALVTACQRLFGADAIFTVGRIQRDARRSKLMDDTVRSIATTVQMEGRQRSQLGKRIGLVLKLMIGLNVNGWTVERVRVSAAKGTEFAIQPFVAEVQATIPMATPVAQVTPVAQQVAPSAPGDATMSLIADHLIDLKSVIAEELAKQTKAIVDAMNLHWGPAAK